MDVPPDSARGRRQARDNGNPPRPSTSTPVPQNSSERSRPERSSPERSRKTSSQSPGIVETFWRYVMPPRISPHEDVQETVRLVHQLQDGVRETAAENEKLKEFYRGLEQAYDEATAKEEQARMQIQTFLQAEKDSNAYITSVQNELDDLRARTHEAQRSQQASEAEASNLHQQLITFKRSTVQHGKLGNQITDAEVRAKMDKVFYATQDFAVSALRGAQLDLSQLSQDAKDWLSSYSSGPDSPPKSCNPQIIISLLSNTLVTAFAPKYYFGISSNPAIAAAMLLASAKSSAATDVVAVVKPWLEPTRRLLDRLDEMALQKADQSFIDKAVKHFHCLLVYALPMDWNVAQVGLRKIFAAAFELFRLLHHSKAFFRLEVMSIDRGYQQNTMESVNSTEEETVLAGRPLELSVFPAVYKFGNELGDNQDEMTTVCKARVVAQKKPRTLPNHN
ncbi:hypothetical protein LTR08_003276 [Meristemomyces frigidus]|nr:hypothetical protein LTR08_003276 [Meristemomyces frigidus]